MFQKDEENNVKRNSKMVRMFCLRVRKVDLIVLRVKWERGYCGPC